MVKYILCALMLSGSMIAADVYKEDFSSKKWGSWKAAKAVGQFVHNTEAGHSAPGALEIKVGPENPAGQSLCFLNHLPVEPGKTYTAIVSVQGKDLDPNAEIGIAFQGQDGKKAFLGTGQTKAALKGSEVPSDSWKRLSLTLKIPAGGKWADAQFLLVTLLVNNTPAGSVLFDDFEFFEDKAAWGQWKSAKAIGVFQRNMEIRRSGVAALEIKVGPENSLDQSLCFLNHYAVEGGKTYKATVYVQGKDLDPNAEIAVAFQGQNDKKAFLGTGQTKSVLKGKDVPSDGWKELVLTFKVPTEGKWANVKFLLATLGVNKTGAGSVLFDDFEFAEVTE